MDFKYVSLDEMKEHKVELKNCNWQEIEWDEENLKASYKLIEEYDTDN
jgi:hypothetical protein